MAVDQQYVVRFAPEFDSINDGKVIEAFVAQAMTDIAPALAGDDYSIFLLTAHMLAMAYPEKIHKMVSSESLGPGSRSYVAPPAPAFDDSAGAFAETKWGRLYWTRLKQSGGFFGISTADETQGPLPTPDESVGSTDPYRGIF